MVVYQIFATIVDENIVSVSICDNYQTANEVARGAFGDNAFAIECTQYPCSEGDKYINGRFYRISPSDPSQLIEIEYIPTQEQEVAMLKAQNALMVNALSFAASTFSDEQAVKVVELYPEWSPNSINYKVGERIRDEEFNLYKVIKEHVSQESLKPSVSSSLFSKLSI